MHLTPVWGPGADGDSFVEGILGSGTPTECQTRSRFCWQMVRRLHGPAQRSVKLEGMLCGKTNESLTLSAVQLVPFELVDAVKSAFQKLLTFTESVVDGEKAAGPKREAKLWTPDAAKKCRRLGRRFTAII